MNELALFAGAGGGIQGGMLLGWRTVCAVELSPYRRALLCQRQNDGILPPFPIWDDVRTFDGKPWRGIVDVVSGGFPCQDISCAGNGAGINGSRSGLWKEQERIIWEVRPKFVFVENSPAILVRGVEHVFGALAEMGYNYKYGVFSGRHVGAPIKRERIFIAGTNEEYGKKRVGNNKPEKKVFGKIGKQCPDFWLQAPPVNFGVEHGLDNYLEQVEAIGDGQMPAVVAFAWNTLICNL